MISEIPYKLFSDKVHDLKDSERIPLSGSFELTYRCNLSCVHCLTACNWHKEKELNKEEIFRIVDEFVEAGCLWLLFTGGEPLLREDFLDIYTYVKKKGVFITLFTNGTLITPEIADYFAKWKPFSIEITLHSMNKEIFESVTRVPGSFEKCMQGIKLLSERRIPFEVKTMVMTLNKNEVEGVSRYAELLGINYRFCSNIEPKIDASKEPLQFRISPKESVGLDNYFKKQRTAYEKNCKNIIPRDRDRLYACTGGSFSFHIDPYGRLMPCSMLPDISADLRKAPFALIWPGLYEEMKRRQPSHNFRCRGCKIWGVCEACPAIFLREMGEEERVSEFYCEIAQRRFETFKGGDSYEEALQGTKD